MTRDFSVFHHILIEGGGWEQQAAQVALNPSYAAVTNSPRVTGAPGSQVLLKQHCPSAGPLTLSSVLLHSRSQAAEAEPSGWGSRQAEMHAGLPASAGTGPSLACSCFVYRGKSPGWARCLGVGSGPPTQVGMMTMEVMQITTTPSMA